MTAWAVPTSTPAPGCRGIRDRIEAVSGTLDVAGGRGGGTVLRAQLPIRAADV
jgi:signal transduction histidine kinase